MHESKRFLIAATVAMFGFAPSAHAQQDAAQKASEGSVQHWIEFYKSEQRKAAATPPAADRPAPGGRAGAGAPPREKADKK